MFLLFFLLWLAYVMSSHWCTHPQYTRTHFAVILKVAALQFSSEKFVHVYTQGLLEDSKPFSQILITSDTNAPISVVVCVDLLAIWKVNLKKLNTLFSSLHSRSWFQCNQLGMVQIFQKEFLRVLWLKLDSAEYFLMLSTQSLLGLWLFLQPQHLHIWASLVFIFLPVSGVIFSWVCAATPQKMIISKWILFTTLDNI